VRAALAKIGDPDDLTQLDNWLKSH
jgi:hypothetical protein